MRILTLKVNHVETCLIARPCSVRCYTYPLRLLRVEATPALAQARSGAGQNPIKDVDYVYNGSEIPDSPASRAAPRCPPGRQSPSDDRSRRSAQCPSRMGSAEAPFATVPSYRHHRSLRTGWMDGAVRNGQERQGQSILPSCFKLEAMVWSDAEQSRKVGPFDWCSNKDEFLARLEPDYAYSLLPRHTERGYNTGVSRTQRRFPRVDRPHQESRGPLPVLAFVGRSFRSP
jgi:hypothetical protein